MLLTPAVDVADTSTAYVDPFCTGLPLASVDTVYPTAPPEQGVLDDHDATSTASKPVSVPSSEILKP